MEPKSTPDHGRITTVLVPTDFSEESFQALRYAATLFKMLRANLHVVHVSETDFAIPGPARPGTDPLFSDEQKATLVRQQLHDASGAPVAATFHARTGRAYDQICRSARELEADLVVMSTHGRTGLKRLFLGSNAERVVQHSQVPVLVVRAHKPESEVPPPTQIQKILVPTDFSKSSREALDYALVTAQQFRARLVLFHSCNLTHFLTPEPHVAQSVGVEPELARDAAEAEMREFVRGIEFDGIEFETHITLGQAAEEICAFAAKENVDLIVTSTHGRTGFMHVLIGSVAEHVVRNAPTPVLVVPGRRAEV